MWEKLCKLLEMENLVYDPGFQTIPDRVENKDALKDILEQKLVSKSTEEWVELLNKEGIACGPIYTIDQTFRDKQVLHQEILMEVEHRTAGKIKMIGFAVKLNRTPCRITCPPTCFGQNTFEILRELNYSEQEINEFKERGII